MPDKKLTDAEIVKALKCCSNFESHEQCKKCPFKGKCQINELEGLALDLINRLQAESERLCAEIDELIIAKDLLFDEAEALIKKAKAEAYKEFAEMLKCDWIANMYFCEDLDITDWIDNLLKELVGDNNV